MKPDRTPKNNEREFWGMVSIQGTFLAVGAGIRDVLGWGVGEVIGRRLLSFVAGSGNGRQVLEEQLGRVGERKDPIEILCEMRDKEGRSLPVQIVLYRGRKQVSTPSPLPIIYQIKALDSLPPPTSQNFAHPHHANVFEELETSRGSSWQYELQQLKFANQRLSEEVHTLEASLLLHDQQRNAVPQFATQGQNTYSSQHISHDWASPLIHEYEPQRLLKRAWDSDHVPSS